MVKQISSKKMGVSKKRNLLPQETHGGNQALANMSTMPGYEEEKVALRERGTAGEGSTEQPGVQQLNRTLPCNPAAALWDIYQRETKTSVLMRTN